MSTITASAERAINAPADRVYRIIADYKNHHANILPKVFSNLKVVQGGVGAGTVISFNVTTAGRTRIYLSRILEPEPGRVLTETDTQSGTATTFTVTPDGQRCRIRIDTQWEGKRGFAGVMERLVAPGVLRRIYNDELSRLEAYAQKVS